MRRKLNSQYKRYPLYEKENYGYGIIMIIYTFEYFKNIFITIHKRETIDKPYWYMYHTLFLNTVHVWIYNITKTGPICMLSSYLRAFGFPNHCL